jgi:hypothetical protein
LPTRACRGFPGVAFASVDFVARSPRGSAARGIPASRTALLHQVPLRPRRTSIVRAAPGSTRESFDRTSRRPTSLRRDPVLAEPRSQVDETCRASPRAYVRHHIPSLTVRSRQRIGGGLTKRVVAPSRLPALPHTCPPRQDLSERLRPPTIRQGVQGLVEFTADPPRRPGARRAHRRSAKASRRSSRKPQSHRPPKQQGATLADRALESASNVPGLSTARRPS